MHSFVEQSRISLALSRVVGQTNSNLGTRSSPRAEDSIPNNLSEADDFGFCPTATAKRGNKKQGQLLLCRQQGWTSRGHASSFPNTEAHSMSCCPVRWPSTATPSLSTAAASTVPVVLFGEQKKITEPKTVPRIGAQHAICHTWQTPHKGLCRTAVPCPAPLPFSLSSTPIPSLAP